MKKKFIALTLVSVLSSSLCLTPVYAKETTKGFNQQNINVSNQLDLPTNTIAETEIDQDIANQITILDKCKITDENDNTSFDENLLRESGISDSDIEQIMEAVDYFNNPLSKLSRKRYNGVDITWENHMFMLIFQSIYY